MPGQECSRDVASLRPVRAYVPSVAVVGQEGPEGDGGHDESGYQPSHRALLAVPQPRKRALLIEVLRRGRLETRVIPTSTTHVPSSFRGSYASFAQDGLE